MFVTGSAKTQSIILSGFCVTAFVLPIRRSLVLMVLFKKKLSNAPRRPNMLASVYTQYSKRLSCNTYNYVPFRAGQRENSVFKWSLYPTSWHFLGWEWRTFSADGVWRSNLGRRVVYWSALIVSNYAHRQANTMHGGTMIHHGTPWNKTLLPCCFHGVLRILWWSLKLPWFPLGLPWFPMGQFC